MTRTISSTQRRQRYERKRHSRNFPLLTELLDLDHPTGRETELSSALRILARFREAEGWEPIPARLFDKVFYCNSS